VPGFENVDESCLLGLAIQKGPNGRLIADVSIDLEGCRPDRQNAILGRSDLNRETGRIRHESSLALRLAAALEWMG
jgi:hypothetical protein